MTNAQLHAILLEVLASEHGHVVLTNDPDQLKKRLYILRASARKSGDTSLDCLSFRTSPSNPKGELWIFKNKEQETSNGEVSAS